jgi:hypothetical protein
MQRRQLRQFDWQRQHSVLSLQRQHQNHGIAGELYNSGGVSNGDLDQYVCRRVPSSSVSASTLYYIYLWNDSGTWVLDAETTGHVTDRTSGIES